MIRLEDIFIRVRIDVRLANNNVDYNFVYTVLLQKSNPEKRKRDRLVLAEVLGLDKPESGKIKHSQYYPAL